MPKQGESLLHTLVSAFQDANLEASRYKCLPLIQDETARSHLARIIDSCDIEMWDDTLTYGISKEVILTLLQCTARLYEDKRYTKAATELIESTHTRAILSLGIQDVFYCVVHRQYIASIGSDSEARSAENYSQRVELFSAIRNNKARQLNCQAMVFEHISSLCRSHAAVLQNIFDSPRKDEQFMHHNCITLSKAYSCYEKSCLITLLPDLFDMEWQGPWRNPNGGGSLVPNFGAIKETNRDATFSASRAISPSQATTATNIIRGTGRNVNMLYEKPIFLESVEYLYRGFPQGEQSPLVIDRVVQRQAMTGEQNKLQVFCGECGTGNAGPDLATKKGVEFEKDVHAPRRRAMTYPKSPSLKAVASTLNDYTATQKGEKAIGTRIERGDTRDYCEEWKDGLLDPFPDVPYGNWEPLGSDDDSIFPFSLDSHSDSVDGKLTTPLLYDVDNELRDPLPFAKDMQHAPSGSASSLQSSNDEIQ